LAGIVRAAAGSRAAPHSDRTTAVATTSVRAGFGLVLLYVNEIRQRGCPQGAGSVEE